MFSRVHRVACVLAGLRELVVGVCKRPFVLRRVCELEIDEEETASVGRKLIEAWFEKRKKKRKKERKKCQAIATRFSEICE